MAERILAWRLQNEEEGRQAPTLAWHGLWLIYGGCGYKMWGQQSGKWMEKGRSVIMGHGCYVEPPVSVAVYLAEGQTCRVNVLLHRLWASPNSVPELDRAGLDKPTELFWCSSNGFSLIKSWNPTYSFIPKCSCRAISATIPTIGFWGIPYIHRGNIQIISNDYMQLKCDNSAMAIGAEINPTSWL